MIVLLHFQCSDKFYFLQAVVIGSSLASHSREMREEAMTRLAIARSIKDEMVRAPSVAKELKGHIIELEGEK